MEGVFVSVFLHFILRIFFLEKPLIYEFKFKTFTYNKRKIIYYKMPNNLFSVTFKLIIDYFLKINYVYFTVNPRSSKFYIFLENYIFPYLPFFFLNFFQDFCYNLIYFFMFFRKVRIFFKDYYRKKFFLFFFILRKYFFLFFKLFYYYYFIVWRALVKFHFLT
jgi:hypothetical protein